MKNSISCYKIIQALDISRYLNAFFDQSPKVQCLSALSSLCFTELPKFTMNLIHAKVFLTPFLLKINNYSLRKNSLYVSVLLSQ